MKLKQETVDAGCEAAQARYAAMPIHEAQLAFSYELQGFVACMAETHDAPFLLTATKIAELLAMLAKANA